MINFVDRLKYSFFGSEKNRVRIALDSKKTLEENFHVMCSLSFLKTRSVATLNLISALKLCVVNHLDSFTVNNSFERNIEQDIDTEEKRIHVYFNNNITIINDILSFELAKKAINCWLEERGYHSVSPSYRIKQVIEFQKLIQTKQESMIAQLNKQYNALSQKTFTEMRRFQKSASWTPPNIGDRINNMLTNDVFFEQALSKKQKTCFQQIRDWLKRITTNHENQKNTYSLARNFFSKCHMAIFMPFMNTLFDFDCFNCAFDYVFNNLDFCFDLVRLF